MRRCVATTTSGKPCSAFAVKGATVCNKHGGSAPQVRAKAAVRAEVMAWGLGDTHVSPEETLLRLISQSSARAQRYAAELEELVAEAPNLRDALIRQAYGEFGPVGEYARGLVVLEAEERDRLAGFCGKAIAAGLAKRQIELAERQVDVAERALLAALEDIGLSAEQRQRAVDRLGHHLRLVG